MNSTVAELFGPSSPLKFHLKGFEERKEQQDLAQDIAQAFCDDKQAIIEAGTGIGKSFAYLIPALVWAVQNGEPVVISTNTIALQEQLIEKDIPLALQVLGIEAKVVLAKGMGNYLCLRKLGDLQNEQTLFPADDQEEVDRIARAARYSSGSKADLGFVPAPQSWQKVAAESQACSYAECPHFHDCFFFKARKELQEAHLIVTNHHLLFADIARRRLTDNFSHNAILPRYTRLILDEAHHIEDVATEYFAERCSRGEILSCLHELEVGEERSRFTALRRKLGRILGEQSHLVQKIDRDIAFARREAATYVHRAFEELNTFCLLFPTANEEEGSARLRIKEQQLAHASWKERVVPALTLALKHINDLLHLLVTLDNEIAWQEEMRSLRVELNAQIARLGAQGAVLDCCSRYAGGSDRVQWVERSGARDIALVHAEHTVAPLLQKYLFSHLKTAVLCSATLTTRKSFSYIRSRFGLSTDTVERIYESPFDYKSQALFGVPIDLPLPDDPLFMEVLPEALVQCVEASRGNAFILFTSYTMLKNCYEQVASTLTDKGFFLLKQGDSSRQELIRRFKERPRSVLFGTDSFWEGVDVAGDALRCVIITKLPFHVPSDPIQEARCERLVQEKRSPFIDYSVPRAAVKFKQAFGRLIRTKSDRGCVICLDTRLIKRAYGKLFLQSLPPCTESFEPLKALVEKMRLFYRVAGGGVRPSKSISIIA